MPECPSIVLLRVAVSHFKGHVVRDVSGNSRIDLSPLLAILILQFVKNGILYSVGFGPRLLF